MNKLKNIKGWHYLIVLIIIRGVWVLFADGVTSQAIGQFFQIIAFIPFLSFLFYLAYFRIRNIYGKIGWTFYLFIYSYIHILIFGSTGFSQFPEMDILQQFEFQDNNPFMYWAILSGPMFGLYLFVYQCLIIFKKAKYNQG